MVPFHSSRHVRFILITPSASLPLYLQNRLFVLNHALLKIIRNMTLPLPDLRAEPDQLLADIADYVIDREIRSELAYATARHCLMDSLGCAMQALTYPACARLLGPIRIGTERCPTALEFLEPGSCLIRFRPPLISEP